MKLTERELGVLRLYADGGDRRRVAELMGVSPATVRSHVANIRKVFGAATIAQAVHLAHAEGLL